MRDLETIGTALHAAETGHMVFRRCTLWTRSKPSTVSSPSSRRLSRNRSGCSLLLCCALVVSQRLVRRCDADGRVPAVEVMINTAYIRECILVPEKTRAVRDAISAGTSQYGIGTTVRPVALGFVPGRPRRPRQPLRERLERRRHSSSLRMQESSHQQPTYRGKPCSLPGTAIAPGVPPPNYERASACFTTTPAVVALTTA